jgi:hypothetical protein
MNISRMEKKRVGLPGEKVAVAGVYVVLHRDDHREPHEVVLLAGQDFPGCEQCRDHVRFELLRAAPYLFDDPDFRNMQEAPGPRRLNKG